MSSNGRSAVELQSNRNCIVDDSKLLLRSDLDLTPIRHRGLATGKKRDSTITDRLRHAKTFTSFPIRTEKFRKLFIPYCVNLYD